MNRAFAWMLTAAVMAPMAVAAPSVAFAQEEGIPVTVEVRDGEGAVVPTAVIRHPQEAEKHKVNTETGRWTEKVLYMSDGSEFIFRKGEILTFEVSAPGFKNASVTYVVRKRKNVISVVLEKMEFDLDEDYDQEPNINFGRDKPIDP